jgi:DNA-binding response OmpR family regulator
MVTAPVRTLVVEDDADSGATLASLLEGLGHSAELLTDARAVVGTVSRSRPDLVFLDLTMPHFDAFDVAELLKAKFSGLCVVALGRVGTEDDYRKRGRKAGFDGYVAKPADAAILQSTLDTLLAGRGRP